MASDQSTTEPTLPPLKILLAEDNLINQKVAVALLTRLGHSVSVAQDGLEALQAVEAENFDAILMDVQMPNMDGLEATRAIRNLPGGKGRLPIIAMTAGSSDDDAERSLAAGMDGHVGKPFDTRKIFALLEQCLKNRQTD
jgi:CheY-like chemotaxis protein